MYLFREKRPERAEGFFLSEEYLGMTASLTHLVGKKIWTIARPSVPLRTCPEQELGSGEAVVEWWHPGQG